MSPDKKALRRHFLQLRDNASPEDRTAWSQAICSHLTHFCQSRRIRKMGIFCNFGSEVDLRPFIESHGDWTFFFPRIASSSPPRLIWGTEPLEKGFWGLMEPVRAQHPTPPVPLLLVPGLAFDSQGFRLGYGKGFYDALLDHLPPEVITLGVGFGLQCTDRVPIAPHDQPVQGRVTEAGIEWLQSKSKA